MLSMKFSKTDPNRNLSRWRLMIVLVPVVWIDALKATVHRTVDLATELSLPLLLRFVVTEIAITQ